MITVDDIQEISDVTEPRRYLLPMAERLADRPLLPPGHLLDGAERSSYNDALRDLKQFVARMGLKENTG